MRKIVSTQSTNNCAGICGRSGVKGFFYRFGVDNINLASPDDNFPQLYFVFSFEPWHDRRSTDALIYETANHTYTVLIVKAPIFLTASTYELIPHHIFECSI